MGCARASKTYSHAKAALAGGVDVRIFGDSWVVKSNRNSRRRSSVLLTDLHRLDRADESHGDSKNRGEQDGDERVRFHSRSNNEHQQKVS
jgi:hypothetical protein